MNTAVNGVSARWLAIAVAVTLTFGLAACSGDDDATGTPPPVPATTETGDRATDPAATGEPTGDADSSTTDPGPPTPTGGPATTEPDGPAPTDPGAPPTDPLGAVCEAWSATLTAGFMAAIIGPVLAANADAAELEVTDEESLFLATVLLTAPAMAPRYEAAAAGLPVDALTTEEAADIEHGAPLYRRLADEVAPLGIDPALFAIIEGIIVGEIDVAAGQDEAFEAEFAHLLVDGLNRASTVISVFDDLDDSGDEEGALTFDRFSEVCPHLTT